MRRRPIGVPFARKPEHSLGPSGLARFEPIRGALERLSLAGHARERQQ